MTTSKLPREIYNLFNGRTFHLSVVVGVVVYKYVAKPVIANIKAQIEQKKMAAEEKTVILEESDVVTEDN